MTSRACFLGAIFAICVAGIADAQVQSAKGSSAIDMTKQSASPRPGRIRVGADVEAANLVHVVGLAHPDDDRFGRAIGTVVLHVIVATDGTIEKTDFVSGPPLLAKAATAAVRQWRYKPTLLNGAPVEVDTTIKMVIDTAEPTGMKYPSTPNENSPSGEPKAKQSR